MAINATDHTVIPAISDRWSPYRFDPKPVEDAKLKRCLEAARWAASSFNDQPWSWIVARRQDTEQFQTMLSCLAEANRGWAANAGVLICTAIRENFEYNGKPNRVALHDLGAAATQLALQAADLGLQAHQMAGVQLSQIKAQYQLPDQWHPQTAIAIGYADLSQAEGEQQQELQQRQAGPRQRRELRDQVFGTKFGEAPDWL